MRRLVTTLAAAMLAAHATTLSAQTQAGTPAAPGAALIDMSGKLDGKLGYVKESGTIIIPGVVLHLLVDGSVSAVAQRGGGTARSKAVFAVNGIDKAFVQALARSVQDDLVARLRADGWTVLTYEDIKDDGDVMKMKRYKPNPDYGMHAEEVKGTDKNYLFVTPTDDQQFDPPMQGYAYGFRGIAKSKSAAVWIPEYYIDAPQLQGETRRGYGSSTAKVNADDGMTLGAALVWGFNHKGGGGIVKLKESANVSEKVGSFVSSEDQSPTAANAVSKGLSLLAGGAINRKKVAYQFTADPELYRAATLRAAGSFNAALAAEAKKEKRQ